MIDINEKIGNYVMDVSKYVITGVLITAFFRDFSETLGSGFYVIGTLMAVALFVFSLYFYIKSNNKNKNKKNKRRK